MIPNERLKRLGKAVATLKRFTFMPVENDRDRYGVVRAFRTASELAWTCVEDWTKAQGFAERGPKGVLQAAFRGELISEDEEEDLQAMLDDRNILSHTYREEAVLAIADRIVTRYADALLSLHAKLVPDEPAARGNV